ncbi:MAG: hypothetical protein H0V09_02520 [Gemmatimonadetes bacterium]|nr:hypothetical protein [Gemmatimonadota bacterium]
MDWFYLYALSWLVVIAGVGLGMNLIGIPPIWNLIAMGLLLVIAVATALRRPRDDSGSQP